MLPDRLPFAKKLSKVVHDFNPEYRVFTLLGLEDCEASPKYYILGASADSAMIIANMMIPDYDPLDSDYGLHPYIGETVFDYSTIDNTEEITDLWMEG